MLNKEDKIKKSKFKKICRDIKSIKIQGATNIARQGLTAYLLLPSKKSKKKLLSLRKTEPLLKNAINFAEKNNLKLNEFEEHLKKTQEKINKELFKIIKNKKVIFTHCHSSSVVNALIYCKQKGINFEVYHTETRPLFQGRKTAKKLRDSKIKVTTFIDSAAGIALNKKQGTKKVDIVLFGADAITPNFIVNKVGSDLFANMAKHLKIPVYILADSWKFTKKIEIEKRSYFEAWKIKLKNKHNILNPAFEKIEPKNISGIISDLGTLEFNKFIKIVEKQKIVKSNRI